MSHVSPANHIFLHSFENTVKNRAILEEGRYCVKLSLYDQLRIILTHARSLIHTGAAICLLLTVVLCIFFNFVTLKLHVVVPMPLYLYFPTVSILLPVMLEVILPPAIRINTESMVLIHTLKSVQDPYAKQVRNRYFSRRVESMKSCTIEGGAFGYRLFNIVRETKSECYYIIVDQDHTITALLAVDVTHLRDGHITHC